MEVPCRLSLVLVACKYMFMTIQIDGTRMLNAVSGRDA